MRELNQDETAGISAGFVCCMGAAAISAVATFVITAVTMGFNAISGSQPSEEAAQDGVESSGCVCAEQR